MTRSLAVRLRFLRAMGRLLGTTLSTGFRPNRNYSIPFMLKSRNQKGILLDQLERMKAVPEAVLAPQAP